MWVRTSTHYPLAGDAARFRRVSIVQGVRHSLELRELRLHRLPTRFHALPAHSHVLWFPALVQPFLLARHSFPFGLQSSGRLEVVLGRAMALEVLGVVQVVMGVLGAYVAECHVVDCKVIAK